LKCPDKQHEYAVQLFNTIKHSEPGASMGTVLFKAWWLPSRQPMWSVAEPYLVVASSTAFEVSSNATSRWQRLNVLAEPGFDLAAA